MVAYATGRFFASVVEVVRTTPLPTPDAVLCNVGTEIRDYPSGDRIGGWQDRVSSDWDADRVRRVVSALPGVRLQPAKWQSELKASFFLEDASAEQLDDIYETLWRESIYPQIVYSSNRDLDVLPAGANKGTAAAFLASNSGIPRHHVVASGDSGNDRALFQQGFRGTVVANAQPELRKLNGSLIYHAKRSHAAGVLEGLRFWLNQDDSLLHHTADLGVVSTPV